VAQVDTWKRRERWVRFKEYFDWNYPELAEESAILIQRIARGYRARRRVRLLRELRQFLIYDKKMKRRRKAIVDVQRVFRGRRGRRIAAHARQTILTRLMQRLWRGYRARQLYKRLKIHTDAGMVVQKFTRWVARARG
jgi:hypothetical protein